MQIKEIKEIKIVGFEIESCVEECTGPNNPLPKLWEEFNAKYKEIKNITNENIMYGPCFEIDPPEEGKFRYMAGIEVSKVEDLPKGMTQTTIPEGKYAVYEHKGKISQINQTYEFIINDLKKQGEKEDYIWFELYDSRYKHEDEDSICEIWCKLE